MSDVETTNNHNNHNIIESGGWAQPVPLDEVAIPEFPVETLPDIGRDMVQHVADCVQCDVTLPAAALLGIYAMSIQRRVTVSVGPPAGRNSSLAGSLRWRIGTKIRGIHAHAPTGKKV